MAEFAFSTSDLASGGSETTGTSGDPLGATDFLTGSASGAGTGDDFTFDPDRHISRDKRNADGSYRRKRQRRGAGNSSASTGNRKAKNSASVDTLNGILTIIHTALAAATKTPELALEDEESRALATATANVLNEFDITPDPKIQAIVGLIATAGMIYGPRVVLIRMRKASEEKEAEKPTFAMPYNPGSEFQQ